MKFNVEKYPEFIWKLARGKSMSIGPVARIMAIVNVTPDSFSDGANYFLPKKAVAHAISSLKEGADIIDIGGESTRPGFIPVTAKQEQERILPVIEALADQTDAIISVDTYQPETAELAIRAGAHIINDVCGLQQGKNMAKIIAQYGAGVCIMHTGRGRKKLSDVFEDQYYFLEKSLKIAHDEGISRDSIVIDPGFGFAKEIQENFSLMANVSKLRKFNLPILVGISRKRFLGKMKQKDRSSDVSTAAANCFLRIEGAAIFRVHNVGINRDSLRMTDTIIKAKNISSKERE
ncbi:dihydropteroate synthase [Candidatus Liberibacter solanacearum]|uniref:dihydropteroate synthase n=1 Tax=Candidatus Liberibacter solanacearum TaxID=556287 RepID=A0A3R7NIW0_9HYPH|nr:dihydropteroate synthase [Candidatus Liberibacter solanacearum]RPD37054.1 dihydropteroate synthase [Candidatus Liberibacter solanacearum]